MKALGGCLFTFFIALVAGPIWSGYVLSILWGWFLVPLHMPAITIPEAMGLALAIGMLTSKMPEQKEEETDQTRTTIALCSFALFYPLVALACGAIVHLFM